MIDYKVGLSGDTRVALRFSEFPSLAHDGLRRKIEALTSELADEVFAAIPRKTGKLAAQLKSGIDDSENRIRGWVSMSGANAELVKQAAALEYGSRNAKFQVKSYERTIEQMFGHMIDPLSQVVDAYMRTGGLAAEDFLRGPLHAGAEHALAEMNAAVDGGYQGRGDNA